MKTALILHGWEGNPGSHWLPWLGIQCEKTGYKIAIPELSNSEYPVLEEQLEDLDNTHLKSGDVIIGHSLGCQLAMQVVEKRKLEGVKVILVAPTYPNLADELGEASFGDAFQKLYDYYNIPNDFRKLNKLGSQYTIFFSDNDPYINRFTAEKYYEPLKNTKIITLAKKGHFNTSAGVMELPEILKYI